MIFYITDKCNLKCSHCFYWRHINKKTDEMSLGQIKKVIRSLKNRLESVVITGGEPFLRKEIFEICKYFERYNKTKKIIIATNATLPETVYEKVNLILKKTNLDLDIQISLDGLEKTHDEIRGVHGSFQNVIKTVNKLKKLKMNGNFNVSISTTISKKNIAEIPALMDFVQKELKEFHGLQIMRNSKLHSFNVPKEILSDFDSQEKILGLKEIKAILEKINEKKTNKNDPLLDRITEIFNEYMIEILEKKKPLLKCRAGKIDGVVYSNGNVAMCEFTKSFAQLKDYNYDFYKLWNSNKAKRMREKISCCFCIHPCNLITSMRSDRKALKKIFN